MKDSCKEDKVEDKYSRNRITGSDHRWAFFKTLLFIYKVRRFPLAVASSSWQQLFFILQYLQYEV